MKKYIKLLAILLVSAFGFTSCEEDNELIFTAAPQGEFTFTNTFLPEYILPAENSTDDNIGVVFSFNAADFGVQTNISYELQSSILGDFTDATVVASSSNANNPIEVTIGNLKVLAEAYGIMAPSSGTLNFRIRAFPGDSSSTTESFTPTQTITVTLLEAVTGGSGIEVSTWGIVGSGYNDWGNAGLDGVFYTTSTEGVIVAYANLVDGEIKFRENNDWASNLGDTGADGILEANGDNIVVTAGSYKITINTNDNTYTIEAFSWGIVGSGYNDWGNAGPDAKFFYDYTTDTYKVSVKLVDGEIKFRLNNDWGNNLGDTGADGTLEANGDNLAVTAGFYDLTLDLNNNIYTIESGDVWGIVGSGYNDWGNGGSDYSFTKVTTDVYVAEVVTLLDGEIKFRLNEDWGSNLGDTGADGTLDADGDNLAVTAGKYRITFNTSDNSYFLNKVQ